jgi:MFS family permease
VFEALRNRNFRLLWLGSLSAFTGFFASNVVQSVVAFQLTSENLAVGNVVFGRGLAQLLLAPLGGALADRISKRSILVSSQAFTSLVFFWMAWLMHEGTLRVAHLTIGGFLIGLTFAVLGPTRSAYIVEIVEAPARGNAIAMNQVALNASRVAGPAIAGALLAWPAVGATGAFVLMGFGYLGAVGSQYLLPRTTPDPGAARRGLFADVADGLAYVRENPRLRALLLMFGLSVTFGFPYVTVMPGLVQHQLGLPSKQVTVLYAVAAVGGLLASLLVARLADSAHAVRVYRAAGWSFGLSLMLLWLPHTLIGTALLLFVVGATSGAFTTLNGAVLLRHTEPRYMGRVMSLAMLAFGAFGLIGIPVGLLADAVGEGPTVAIMGTLVCTVIAVQSLALARTEPLPAVTAAPLTPQ